MIIRRIIVGELSANCYLLIDEKTKETAVIDPGANARKIYKEIKENGLLPKFILITHDHPDHTGALKKVGKKFNIKYREVKGGEELRIGDLKIKVLATPGHSPESVCFIVKENIFTGDTLFKDGIGRTDFEDGDFGQMKNSLKKLKAFPENFTVFPGHGPKTTIGEEFDK